MNTIALTASTGMLGSMLYRELKDRYRLVILYHDAEKLKALQSAYGIAREHRLVQYDLVDLFQDYQEGFSKRMGPRLQGLVDAIGPVDAIVQSAGVTNRYSVIDPLKTFFLNNALPMVLSAVYKEKLIHITTDCVYDGIDGAPYTERSPKFPRDLYGLTKSLGEPSEQSFVLRTSFIGPEVSDFVGLISWFLNQSGKRIQGYVNHYWNGITTRELARIIDDIVAHRWRFPNTGLYHIFSDDVTKYDMLLAFREKYHINVDIIPTQSQSVDRRLGSIYGVCKQLAIPRFSQMLQAL